MYLVGRNHGNKTQAIAHLVAQTLGERIGRRKGADGAAKDGGGDVIGMALDLGGDADEFGAVDGVACQRGGSMMPATTQVELEPRPRATGTSV